VIGTAEAVQLVTLVACAIGLVALPVAWKLVRKRDVAELPEAPAVGDTSTPLVVAACVFVVYAVGTIVAIGIKGQSTVVAFTALGFAVLLGALAGAFVLPRVARPAVAAPRAIALGLLTFAAAMPVAYGILYLETLVFGEVAPQDTVKALGRGGDNQRTLAFLAAAVAPFMEEVVFRGLLYGGLRRARSPMFALVVSSVLFGLVHTPPLSAVLPMVAFGFFLGTLMERTGSLLACFVAHAAFNSLSVGVLVLS
jgi:membrane protease YdiL (CAAX protease family)